jgi:hypothetical protein
MIKLSIKINKKLKIVIKLFNDFDEMPHNRNSIENT